MKAIYQHMNNTQEALPIIIQKTGSSIILVPCSGEKFKSVLFGKSLTHSFLGSFFCGLFLFLQVGKTRLGSQEEGGRGREETKINHFHIFGSQLHVDIH